MVSSRCRRGTSARSELGKSPTHLRLDPCGPDAKRLLCLARDSGEGLLGQHRAVERQHSGNADDVCLSQSAAGALDGLSSSSAGHDDLGEHRVEVAGHRLAGRDASVHAYAWSARPRHRGGGSGCGEEVCGRVFAVDAELDAVSASGHAVVAERLAGGDAELFTHEVDPRDFLGHAVLNLEAGVDLEERDRSVQSDQELAGACALVLGLTQDGLRRTHELSVLLVAEERRRGLLHQFLVTTLQRAVAGRDHHDVSVRVRQALRLHVPGAVKEPLDEALATAEGCNCLAGGRVEEFGDLLQGEGHLESATATSKGSLDSNGQAVLASKGDHVVGVLDGIRRAGHKRSSSGLGDVACRDLVAQRVDRSGRWADPRQSSRLNGAGEIGVLRQEAVARVDGISAGATSNIQNLG